MKKRLLIIFVLFSFFITGCSNEKKQKEQIKEAATDYYDSYMSGVTGINKAEITLDMLNNAISNGNKKYNLSSLKKCKGETKITFDIKKDKIIKEKYDLICK